MEIISISFKIDYLMTYRLKKLIFFDVFIWRY